MRVSIASVAGLFAMAWGVQPVVAQKTAAATLEMSADGEVQIAPDGTVSDYRLQSHLAPAVAELVDKDVRRWQFKPIVVDGTPVVAKTSMHLDLKAEPVDGKDTYRIPRCSRQFRKRSRTLAQAVRAGQRDRSAILALRLGREDQRQDRGDERDRAHRFLPH
jgi:hypothetical protein